MTRPADRPARVLLVAEDADLAPVIEFAEAAHARRDHLLVLLGFTGPIPFRARPSRIIVPAMPEGVIASMPLLEEQGIASRLASGRGDAGCHDGSVVELAGRWIEALDASARAEVQAVAFGDSALQRAVDALTEGGAILGPS